MIKVENKDLDTVIRKVMKKLVKQGRPCTLYKESSTCAYGNERGEHCAIGWLLPEDDKNFMDYEGDVDDLLRTIDIDSTFNVQSMKVKKQIDFIKENKNVLQYLQDIHDAASDVTSIDDGITVPTLGVAKSCERLTPFIKPKTKKLINKWFRINKIGIQI